MSLKKIAIIGAGAVGSCLAHLLCFKKSCEQLVLLDINEDLAKGVACDIDDCRFAFSSDTEIIATADAAQLDSSDLVVITAGSPRKPGMTREDLLRTNTAVVGSACSAIKNKAPKALILVITNPLDLMVYVAMKKTSFPYTRVFGMGSSLDTGRMAHILSRETGISITSIHPFVFGPHGQDMIVSPTVSFDDAPFNNLLSEKQLTFAKEKTFNRGKEIVDYLKTGSARFAPAAYASQIIDAVNSNSKKIITVSVFLDNLCGIQGIALGIPCVIGSKGIERIPELILTESEKKQLLSAQENIKKSIAIIDTLL